MRKQLKKQVNVAEKLLMEKYNLNQKQIKKQYRKEITRNLKTQIQNNIKANGQSIALAIELSN